MGFEIQKSIRYHKNQFWSEIIIQDIIVFKSKFSLLKEAEEFTEYAVNVLSSLSDKKLTDFIDRFLVY
jgi:hypothetical protein